MAVAAHLVAATGADRFGLVPHDEAGILVGHAVYIQLEETRAEVAVEVADRMHGQGLGTVLIERLASVAEQQGITRFVAEVLPDNRAMLDVFRDGFDARLSFCDGSDTVEFPTTSWRLARERFGDGARGLDSRRTRRRMPAPEPRVDQPGVPPVSMSPRSSA
jgi:GNAT superfamily N-acetyltransferase